MKITVLRLLFTLGLGFCAALAFAQTKESAPKKAAGPNGGRIMANAHVRAEFLVLPDRKVQMTFLNADDKPVAPGTQIVTVTAGSRLAPTRLTFSRRDNVLISNAALPVGDAVPTVVQIQAGTPSTTLTDRFDTELSVCPTCKLGEYACICDE